MFSSTEKRSMVRKESNYDTFASDVEDDAWFRGDSSGSMGGYQQPAISLPWKPNMREQSSSFSTTSFESAGHFNKSGGGVGDERPLTLLLESATMSPMPTLNLPPAEPTVGQKMKKAVTRASTMVGDAVGSFSSVTQDKRKPEEEKEKNSIVRKSIMVKMLGPLGFPVGQKAANSGGGGGSSAKRRGPLMSMRTRGMAMGGLFGGGMRRDQSSPKTRRDTDWVMRGTKWVRKGSDNNTTAAAAATGKRADARSLMIGTGGDRIIGHPQPRMPRQGGPTMEPVISGDFDMDDFETETEGTTHNLRLASMAPPSIPPPTSRPKMNRMSFMPSRLIKSVAMGMGLFRVKTHEHELVDTLANDIGIPSVSAAEVGKLFVNFNVDFEDFMLFSKQDFMNIGVGAMHAQMIVEKRSHIRRLRE